MSNTGFIVALNFSEGDAFDLHFNFENQEKTTAVTRNGPILDKLVLTTTIVLTENKMHKKMRARKIGRHRRHKHYILPRMWRVSQHETSQLSSEYCMQASPQFPRLPQNGKTKLRTST